MVIGTPVTAIAERVVDAMLAHARDPARFAAAQMILPFDIYGPENI